MNLVCGDQVTLIEMVNRINQITEKNVEPIFGPERIGDVKNSKASIEKIVKVLNYEPQFRFDSGLEIAFNWYKENRLV